MLARTSPTLLPYPLALCCNYPVSKCPSASIVVTSTVRVKHITDNIASRNLILQDIIPDRVYQSVLSIVCQGKSSDVIDLDFI